MKEYTEQELAPYYRILGPFEGFDFVAKTETAWKHMAIALFTVAR